MAKKRIKTEKLARLEARTRAIQGLGSLVFLLFCLSIGFVVVATAIPQRRKLDGLELKYSQVKEREAHWLAERERTEIELRALREDPEFLEIQARDRLDLYRPGEKVLRLKSPRQ